MEESVNSQVEPLDPSAEAVSDDLQQLSVEFQRLSDERDSVRDQLLRTMADFQNYRKRQDEQRSIERDRLIEDVMVDFLPILDNFDRAFASIESGATIDSIAEGLAGIRKQMAGLLSARGIERLEVLGQPFDPEVHDALGIVSGSEAEEGTVVEELQPGYRIGNRVMRAAKVRVAGDS